MIIKINCKYNNNGVWCTNKNIKRSLFGIGARCCSEFNDKKCVSKEQRTLKPQLPNNSYGKTKCDHNYYSDKQIKVIRCDKCGDERWYDYKNLW